ncbi:MAG: hypothetical protein FWD36_06555, partial [Treponema sp.]|nr:hypothetical protein [Treponema sp.]
YQSDKSDKFVCVFHTEHSFLFCNNLWLSLGDSFRFFSRRGAEAPRTQRGRMVGCGVMSNNADSNPFSSLGVLGELRALA